MIWAVLTGGGPQAENGNIFGGNIAHLPAPHPLYPYVSCQVDKVTFPPNKFPYLFSYTHTVKKAF
jgi:hypothetical protein